MQDLIGKNVGQFQIIEQIGKGGMATIFKAYQPSIDRYVAIKILPREFADDPNFLKRFTQEAKAIA
ncbi:MAG: serine/threonine protein kinase, partial [Chloroflexi bacterium]